MTDKTHAAGNSTPVRRLLVVMPSWVGDCVMATAALRAIRERGSSAGNAFHVAGYMRPHLVPLFEAAGVFDECLGGRPRGVLGPALEAPRLHALRCDAALLLPNSFRAALTVRLARVPRRIGYDRDRRGWLLSDRIPCPVPGGWDEPVPLVEYFLKLAIAAGLAADGDPVPRLAVTATERARAQSLLAAGGIDVDRPIALLNPGATKPGKRWPADRFAALADLLHDRGMQIVVNGAPDERPLTGEIVHAIRRATVLDLAPLGMTLATLAAICGLVELVVTNDTGTRHIAVAVGAERRRRGESVPGIVTIFGTVPPEWTTLNYFLESELCDRDSGRIDAISLEQVFEACRRIARDMS